ncbi:hypothetical protein GFS31_15780 [Leptolyngbya sp. BL0902]|uniref:DUF1887 family protein n=1 Tax=Leptolyngbya sp. BL0902 TaxID=1115757 RepID=UPI0018E88A06|nr:DUF1887 family protein [Leptolyngbya sp. BL0902]QQE64895.1 hypothetical protein GFS31_15780 [Leptolyngbya sp. BL0902]
MQKWIADGLIVGLTTIVVGGGTAIILPKNARATLMGSGLGAITSSMVLAKRRNQLLIELESQIQDVRSLQHLNQAEALAPQVSTPDYLEGLDSRDQVDWDGALPRQDQRKDGADSSSEDESVIASTNIRRQSDDLVIDWLLAREIKVENHRLLDQNVDEIFNRHAVFLGNHLKDENQQPLLSPLLKRIKWSISKNRGVQYHLKNSSQLQIKTSTQFCCNLRDDTLLSSYYYSKNDKIIHAAIQDRGDVRRFFNGEWFERFIYYRMTELLSRLDLAHACLINPVIQFPNGDRFELDLLFLVGGEPLLVECKTGGDFNAHLRKFSDHLKRLSIPPERGFLVILDLEDAQIERLSQFWKFRVVNQDRFVPLLEELIR